MSSPRTQLEKKVAELDATVEHFKGLLRKKLIEYNRKIDVEVNSEIANLKEKEKQLRADLDEVGLEVIKIKERS